MQSQTPTTLVISLCLTAALAAQKVTATRFRLAVIGRRVGNRSLLISSWPGSFAPLP